jgi:hypothetical protein
MRRMRVTIALLAVGVLVACSSASDKQHRSGSPPSVSPTQLLSVRGIRCA